MKFIRPAAAGLTVLALATLTAKADSVSYDLGISNLGSGYSGSFGTVTVNLVDSTHATITFTSGLAGGNIYLFGDGGTVGVNVNAGSWTLGGMTRGNSGTGFTLGNGFLSDGGSGNEDGFGSFNQTINTFDGFTHSSDTVSFTLTDNSGTWANAASVLSANASGYLVAAHIFVTSSPADASNGAIITGFATNVAVPDGGSTVALLGCGLAGIGMISRKFRKN